MANFVKMTAPDGRDVFVNTDEIVLIEGFQDFTRITFSNGKDTAVKDEPYHIIGGMPGAGKRS
jgi:uncharacterized protein YlzI (FlbEa/FlbD family)